MYAMQASLMQSVARINYFPQILPRWVESKHTVGRDACANDFEQNKEHIEMRVSLKEPNK